MLTDADEIWVRMPGDSEPLLLSGARLQQEPRTASRVIAGQAVVITIDENKLHVLNDVGSRIWHLCTGRTAAEVLDSLVAEFDVSRSRAAADLARFVTELSGLRALRVEPALPRRAPVGGPGEGL